ncbi:MAG: oligosaccharide flippase family protein [Bacteroidetes bacterium]|nr:oligosaccharide flippase family protein [Bacteroidota bacterium]
MQNRFVKNLLLLLSLNLLIKPFWILGIDRSVQNRVGDADYGLFLSLTSFSFLFYILLDLGITNFNNRNIARNQKQLRKHFAGIMGVKIILGVAYILFLLLLGKLIGYEKQQMALLFWVGINALLLSMIMYLRSNVSGLMLFAADSLLSVLDRLLMIVFCSILLWTTWFGSVLTISAYIYAQTLAYALTFVVALLVVMRHAGRLVPVFDRRFMWLILRRSAPYALLVLLMSFYNRLEPVLIERLLPGDNGLTQTGIYAKAFRLFDAGNNISMLFAVLLLPMFANMLKNRQPVLALTRLSFSIIFSLSAIVAISGILYAEPLMKLLYGLRPGEDPLTFEIRIAQSALIFQLLMLAYVAVSTTYVFGTLLTANGNLRLLNTLAASGVALSIVLNLLLIPPYKATGAAIASLSVQSIMALAQYLAARKVAQLYFGKTFAFRLLLFTGLLLLLAFGISLMPLSWMMRLLLTGLTGLLVPLLSGLLPPREIISFFSATKPDAEKA